MATKKVIYFIAGKKPTGPEATAIAALNTRTVPELEVVVRTARKPTDAKYGDVGSLEPADYKAGSPPTGYTGLPDVPAVAAPVTNGQAVPNVTVTGTAGAGKTATFTVVNGVVTAIALS